MRLVLLILFSLLFLVSFDQLKANDAEIVGNLSGGDWISVEELRAIFLGYGASYRKMIIVGDDYYLLEDILTHKAKLNTALATTIRASRVGEGSSSGLLYASSLEKALLMVSVELENISYAGKNDIYLVEGYGLIIIAVE